MILYKKKYIKRDSLDYLIRYSIPFLTCKWFAVKVHKILMSDDHCQHDHPWAFLTFLIKGGYVEHTPTRSKVYSRFSLLFRKACYVHRLEIHQPVWTIVVTFRKTRLWGFVTPKGWVKWFDYSATKNLCE